MPTLRQAIDTMGKRGIVRTQSDTSLAQTVADLQKKYLMSDPTLPVKARVTPAAGLNDVLDARPITVMLELARGTALNVSDAVASFGRRWSALKYLGLFENNTPAGTLILSPSALAEVGANQRRVISEELGIGFAAHAAKHWCQTRFPGVGAISIIDVDRTLLNGSMPKLQRNGRRQPDYLLAFDDPTSPGSRRFEVLEAKGTVSTATAKSQLGRAVTQLAGLTVNRQTMTGLAVSTVSTENGITLLAVDPEEFPVSWTPNKSGTDHWRGDLPNWSGEEPVVDFTPEELAAKATNVDYASLAEFAGLSSATDDWLTRFSEGRHSEVMAETKAGPGGTSFIGQEFVFQVGSEVVRMFQGVESDVADGLRSVDPIAVLQAQRKGRPSHVDVEDALKSGSGRDVASAVATSSDGAVLQLTVG
ncbi:hypothetical protein ITJ50_02905 [Curtobacterium sp. VKM Ac-2889]|uniref:hypothetical protein n=1 Tax=Curtobacterium TaxID=2034 RepID=UPI00188CB34A|nr:MULTISPECIES: hypothetical protein [Curtobacterium]MBF4598067.1 hypothetical protein [Curtobacterium sp. VKM Ac-1796]MBF4610163.1 hypothetical protein [Curtobacterium sp. VKM Ac-2889]MDD1386465.1 hypothetical protein [Curtobacterium flaccumfaciens pv. poinsettiae]